MFSFYFNLAPLYGYPKMGGQRHFTMVGAKDTIYCSTRTARQICLLRGHSGFTRTAKNSVNCVNIIHTERICTIVKFHTDDQKNVNQFAELCFIWLTVSTECDTMPVKIPLSVLNVQYMAICCIVYRIWLMAICCILFCIWL